MFEAVRKLAAEKPVVAQVGTLAASAGYMIASAADHIVARQSSIVGSIGVLVQYPDVTGLMDNLGVKAGGREVLAAQGRAVALHADHRGGARHDPRPGHGQLRLVRRPRPGSPARSIAPRCWRVADGSIFTGRQALDRKLVDSARRRGGGGAPGWATRGVDARTRSRRVEAAQSAAAGSACRIQATIARALGLDRLGTRLFAPRRAPSRIFLDGLLSVWQPDLGAAAATEIS